MRFVILAGFVLIAQILPAADAAARGEITSYAIVQDDATLRVQGKTIRLFGVYIPPTERGCTTTIRPRRCGSRAARALDFRIQGFVTCRPQARYRDRSLSAICYVRGRSTGAPSIDLGAWLIEQGWAVALPGAPFAYVTLERIARTNRRGVWGFAVDSIN